MTDEERATAKERITAEIRRRQEVMGHDGPVPAFLNVLMDKMVDDEEKFAAIEERLRNLDKLGPLTDG